MHKPRHCSLCGKLLRWWQVKYYLRIDGYHYGCAKRYIGRRPPTWSIF